MDQCWLTSSLFSKLKLLSPLTGNLDLCFASSKPRLCPFTLGWSCPAMKVNDSQRGQWVRPRWVSSFSVEMNLLVYEYPSSLLYGCLFYYGDIVKPTLITDHFGKWGQKGLGDLVSYLICFTGSWKIAPSLISKVTFLETGGPVCRTQGLRHCHSAGSTQVLAIPARLYG